MSRAAYIDRIGTNRKTMDTIAPQETTPRFGVSARAAARIRHLREKDGNAALMLRVTVSGGGCSGFQYAFSFDNEIAEDDRVFERDGVKVLIDEVSLDFLVNGEVDFKEDLMGSYFVIENPNATSSCGCGTSFSV
jgi:iron-sulfur cluster insertion protein